MARGAGQDGAGGGQARNEVVLVGRVPAAAEERELPSGDLLVSFRVVVDRPAPLRPAAGRAVSVDTLDCTAWGAGVRRTAKALGPGDVVEVQGALRRRFWRAGAAAASRTGVEVGSVRRLVRAAPVPARTRRSRGQEQAEPAGAREGVPEEPPAQLS